MQSGTVKFWNDDRGFGFIAPSNAGLPDVFVHITALRKSGISTLSAGDRVSFDTKPDRRGKAPLAVDIALLKDAA